MWVISEEMKGIRLLRPLTVVIVVVIGDVISGTDIAAHLQLIAMPNGVCSSRNVMTHH